MLNHITVMGRVTRDPELRKTQSQVSVITFTVACDRDRNPDGGEKQTDFIDCVAWRQTAEFVSKYFRRGSMVVVSGRLQSRKWQDRDGNNRTNWEIQVDNVYFGEGRRDNAESSDNRWEAPKAAPRIDQPGPFEDLGDDSGDDLPF